jgi:hypothetical protein
MPENLSEKAPPGWSGTVKAMKKHKNVDNPFALAWYMKKKGHKAHYKPEKKGKEPELKEKYKESFAQYVERRDGMAD